MGGMGGLSGRENGARYGLSLNAWWCTRSMVSNRGMKWFEW